MLLRMLQNASEYLKNIEEMLLQYYMHTDMCNGFKYSTTPECVTRIEMGNEIKRYRGVVSVVLIRVKTRFNFR